MDIYHHTYQSPVGPLGLSGTDDHISAIIFDPRSIVTMDTLPDVFHQCMEELDSYFAGGRRAFSFPIKQAGTDFQQTVWQQLLTIPYGSTISYLQLAKQINNPRSIRAVGTANGSNHLPIVVPCHRVIGSNGSLTGFGGGIWRKKWLLEHEWKYRYGTQELF
ncbi:methylated-DNA--[protein]-cysteine S-methyltransferase [Chitinophaga agrisoli]|uniref:Methylated-DNA--protein-cysteine methyltransferase n=1 Tax=Chitinophaga agrisoli TaxID=2607653 RepID=A0A5B2VME1_9BACT|nr:methylated-DNA--[protein]-cysteine S-methyltransferase [Chitinophaga agrisoli]KAA2239472.1 methylated-DNA--[protein]-cysteine S-methyltransferase [Chitinophaga agrisoli]